MPFKGEELDELLSGFIDGELTETERKLVEEAARSDVRIARRIQLLRNQAGEVAELGRLLSSQAPGNRPAPKVSLAETVIAQARLQAEQLGLPRDHHVFGLHVEASADTNAELASSWSARSRLAAALASAAVLLIAVTFAWQAYRGRSIPLAESGTRPEAVAVATAPSQASPPGPGNGEPATRRVGRFGHLAYVMVVDVQVTAEAMRNRVLEDILAGAGIPRVDPVAANAEILAALNQSRMIVNPTAPSHQPIYLTVIRAEMDDIDTALQNIWKDNDHFPKVSLNIAIDARAALVREILNSTGSRFSLSDSFAVPLTAEDASPQVAASSPFPGASDGVSYISSRQRAGGWSGSDDLAVPQSETMSTILIVTHLVQ